MKKFLLVKRLFIFVLVTFSIATMCSAEHKIEFLGDNRNQAWSDQYPYQKMADENHALKEPFSQQDVSAQWLANAVTPSLESIFRQDAHQVAALKQKHKRTLKRKLNCMLWAFSGSATLTLVTVIGTAFFGLGAIFDLKSCH